VCSSANLSRVRGSSQCLWERAYGDGQHWRKQQALTFLTQQVCLQHLLQAGLIIVNNMFVGNQQSVIVPAGAKHSIWQQPCSFKIRPQRLSCWLMLLAQPHAWGGSVTQTVAATPHT
jgi:hypothetical protein